MSGRKGMGHYSAATKEEAVRLFLDERMAIIPLRSDWGSARQNALKPRYELIDESVSWDYINQKADRARNRIRLPILPGWRWRMHC